MYNTFKFPGHLVARRCIVSYHRLQYKLTYSPYIHAVILWFVTESVRDYSNFHVQYTVNVTPSAKRVSAAKVVLSNIGIINTNLLIKNYLPYMSCHPTINIAKLSLNTV